MKHPNSNDLDEALACLACPTTKHAAIIMAQRDQLGRERYGQDVDANPLTAVQWAQHAVEESADGLKYAIRAREEALKLEMEVDALRTANAALVETVKDRERERDHANDTASWALKENAALAEKVKRLEDAGEELGKASRTFLLTHVYDDDGNKNAISIDEVNTESAVQWEDPPSAGEHVRLRNAINGWSKSKGQP